MYRLTCTSSTPCVIYTDAEGSGGIGACLFRDGQHLWWKSVAPRSLRRAGPLLGYPKGVPVFIYEAMAPLAAVRIWRSHIAGRRVVFMIDNQSALGALRKGRSTQCEPLNGIAFFVLA